jgi:cytochrome c
MDSFEFNKIAGGLLGALVLTMGLGFVSEALFYHAPPAKPGYPLPAEPAASSSAAKPAPAVPLAVLLAKADPKKGEADAKACETCHNLEKGAGPKVGPPLYGVVGRKVASFPGFDYSDAVKKIGGNWTFDKLFAWIEDPQTYAPGTKMAFAGEPDPQRRADIIDYLHTLSDSPLPLPKPPAAAPAKPAPTPAKPAAAAPAPAKPAAPAAPATAKPAAQTPAAAPAPAQKAEPTKPAPAAAPAQPAQGTPAPSPGSAK